MLYTLLIYDIMKKAGLSPPEYMLADIIDRLSGKPKYPHCTLSYEKYGELLCVDVKTIGRHKKHLEELGYIRQVKRGHLASTDKWKELHINDTIEKDKLSSEQLPRTDKMSSTKQTNSPSEKDKMSSLYNNNIYNNNIALPEYLGKSPGIRLLGFYNRLLFKHMNIRASMNIPATLTMFKNMMKTDHELVIASMMLAYFTLPSENRAYSWLSNTAKGAAYPVGLFYKSTNQLKSYLVNERGIDIENLDNLLEILSKYLDTLTKE